MGNAYFTLTLSTVETFEKRSFNMEPEKTRSMREFEHLTYIHCRQTRGKTRVAKKGVSSTPIDAISRLQK